MQWNILIHSTIKEEHHLYTKKNIYWKRKKKIPSHNALISFPVNHDALMASRLLIVVSLFPEFTSSSDLMTSSSTSGNISFRSFTSSWVYAGPAGRGGCCCCCWGGCCGGYGCWGGAYGCWETTTNTNEMIGCFRPRFCTYKAKLGWGQPGLVKWMVF